MASDVTMGGASAAKLAVTMAAALDAKFAAKQAEATDERRTRAGTNASRGVLLVLAPHNLGAVAEVADASVSRAVLSRRSRLARVPACNRPNVSQSEVRPLPHPSLAAG